MTDKDLDRIESRLGITLPKSYRELMRTRADELKGIHEIGQTRCWFDNLLYLDADRVINTNLAERKPECGTEGAFPGWSKTFFLIGTNGAGDYFCLRLKGDEKVWMIGSDCGESDEDDDDKPLKPSKINNSLTAFVKEQIRMSKQQPERPLSSFDDSCPLVDRFFVRTQNEGGNIICQDADAPVSEEKFRQHGIDTQELGRCMLRVVAALAKSNPESQRVVSIKTDDKYLNFLIYRFSNPPAGYPSVGATFRTASGNGYVELQLYEWDEKAGEELLADFSRKADFLKTIDRPQIRKELKRLLQVLHPGVRVTVANADYGFSYTLESKSSKAKSKAVKRSPSKKSKKA